jgi:hypothetical protein
VKNYNNHLWEMPRLFLCASEVPSRSGGPLGPNIEALGFDDAILVATSSQTPILRNASPRRMMTLFYYDLPNSDDRDHFRGPCGTVKDGITGSNADGVGVLYGVPIYVYDP